MPAGKSMIPPRSSSMCERNANGVVVYVGLLFTHEKLWTFFARGGLQNSDYPYISNQLLILLHTYPHLTNSLFM